MTPGHNAQYAVKQSETNAKVKLKEDIFKTKNLLPKRSYEGLKAKLCKENSDHQATLGQGLSSLMCGV